jgi:hypothetical protein
MTSNLPPGRVPDPAWPFPDVECGTQGTLLGVLLPSPAASADVGIDCICGTAGGTDCVEGGCCGRRAGISLNCHAPGTGDVGTEEVKSAGGVEVEKTGVAACGRNGLNVVVDDVTGGAVGHTGRVSLPLGPASVSSGMSSQSGDESAAASYAAALA